MSVSRPTVFGGTISALDSASVAAMDPAGLPLGTRVWNIAVSAFFTLTASTASLVTDQILAVSGITGARWIIVSGGGTVESVTGTPVDNTDPANPVINLALAKIFPLAAGPNLGDSDATLTPGVTIGQYTMLAGTATADRTFTLSNTGAGNLVGVWINIFAQAHNVIIKKADATTLFTVTAGQKLSVGLAFITPAWGMNFVQVLA